MLQGTQVLIQNVEAAAQYLDLGPLAYLMLTSEGREGSDIRPIVHQLNKLAGSAAWLLEVAAARRFRNTGSLGTLLSKRFSN